MGEGSSAQPVRAAGGVVVRGGPDHREYLLVHRPRYDDWSLPKGKLGGRESFTEAAVREIREETGVEVDLGPQIGAVGYRLSNGRDKLVWFWAMTARGGDFVANDEVDAVRWLPHDEAAALVSYGRDRAVLSRAAELLDDATTGRLYLVRHAHAGRRDQWRELDKARPLSSKGVMEASAIKEALWANPLQRLISSPFDRCRQTVEPLARALEIGLELSEAVTEGKGRAGCEAVLADVGAACAVLCTHGDVIGETVAALHDAGIDVGESPRWDKSSTWVLHTRGGGVVAADYVPPPH